MSEQIYIRSRGRIQGPFSEEQLKLMARKSQFSRMHEVSKDGVTWSRASASPELFATVSEANPNTTKSPVVDIPPVVGATSPSTGHQSWYYHQFGATKGPVDFSRLQQLADAGEVVGEDLVWKEGMPEWIHAGRVPGLLRPTEVSAHAKAAAEPTVPQSHYAGMAEPPRVSGLAVASLVLGILWLFGIGSLLAVIFGAVALHQIRISHGRVTGTGLAVAGLTLGILFGALQIIGMIYAQMQMVQ
jgi:hypothetical protein